MSGAEEQLVDPRVGTTVQGRYHILKRLGQGGMGVVYLAEHLLIRRRVAIKTLLNQYTSHTDLVERFRREAIAATSIGNEHIVEVMDMGQFDDGSLFMVLEFLEGGDFGHILSTEGPQSVGRVVRVMLQLCDALTAAHERGIVHRDLKPDNIFLIPRGDNPDFVKVVDFGISKFKGLDESSPKLTATGAALGTPYFMAPEQAQGAPDIDHRADIYAMGGILYYALSGKYPFDAPTLPSLFVQICTMNAPGIRRLRPDIPEALEAVIRRAMSRIPAERYATCQELKSALLPFRELNQTPLVQSMAMAETLATPEPLPRPRSTDSLGAVEASTAQRTGSSGSASLLNASRTLQHPSAPRRSSLPLILSAGALVGVVALGVVGWRVLGQPARAATAVALSASAVSSDTLVTIKIRTVPADAQLSLDGALIANPFEGELPQATEPRRLAAQKLGYRVMERTVTFQFSQTVVLELEPDPALAQLMAQAAAAASAGAAANAGTAAPVKGAAAANTAGSRKAATGSVAPTATATPTASPAVVTAPQTPATPAAAATKTTTGRALRSPF